MGAEQPSRQVMGEDSVRALPTQAEMLRNPHDRDVPPSRLHRRTQRVLLIGFFALLGLAVVFVLLDRWRRGSFTFGVGLMYLAALRWVVDSEVLGVLAVRSRKFDAWWTGCLGLAIVLIALSVEPLPG